MVEVPDVDVGRIREEFESIWLKNVVGAVLQRYNPIEGGNYGDDDVVPTTTTSPITINIQGLTSQDYSRDVAGIFREGATFKAYTKYDASLKNTDRILWNGITFKITQWNEAFKDGTIGFMELILVVVNLK